MKNGTESPNNVHVFVDRYYILIRVNVVNIIGIVYVQRIYIYLYLYMVTGIVVTIYKYYNILFLSDCSNESYGIQPEVFNQMD